MIRHIYVFILVLSLICAAVLIRYAYKRRTMPGAKYFLFALIATIIYNGGYIGELLAPTRQWALFWFHFEHIGIPLQHYFWAMMSLEFARIDRKLLRLAKYALLYHPIFYLSVYFTNFFHGQYISEFTFASNGFFNVLYTQKGPAYIAIILSGTVLALICFGAYIRAYLQASRLHRNSYLIMILASLLPWIAVYLTAASSNTLSIDYFPLFSSVSGLFYVIGIFQYKLFLFVPIATDSVFRHAREGIILIDAANHIIDANLRAISLYPSLKKISKRLSFFSFAQNNDEFLPLINNEKITHFQQNAGDSVHHFSAEITLITTDDGLFVGQILTVSDITQFINDQHKLKTLANLAMNRAETHELSFLHAQIKPHFFNNTLSVISSMIGREPEKAKELIGDLGEFLVRRCYFDSNTDFVPLEDEIETINIFVAIEKARFGDRVQYVQLGSAPPQMIVPRLILQPLIENAINHGILKKAEGGTVTLKIKKQNGSVFFSVEDNGHGMTTEKIHTLLTQDTYTQSVGIYNINKRLIKHYGSGLSMTSSSENGTCVSFSIPINATAVEVL